MKNISKILVGILIFFSACSDPYADDTFLEMDTLPGASYMRADENSHLFALWSDLIEYTGLFNTLNLNNNYTFFAPVNEAVEALLKSKGLSSVTDMSQDEAITLVKYHTIAKKAYEMADFSDGFFPDSTASGDYLSIEFREGGINDIYVNSEALIVELNIEVTNGIIHALGDVLTPVTGSIIDNLDKNVYSIFESALQATGYKTDLNQIYVNGVKQRYTLFAVSDEVFNRNGIKSLQDLISYLEVEDDNYQDVDNKLNQYVGYHIMINSYSYSDLISNLDRSTTSKNMNVVAAKQLLNISYVEEDNDFYINYDGELEKGVGFLVKNINCKNGVIHGVDGLMEVVLPIPTKVQWDLTDYPELAAICDDYKKENLTDETKTNFFLGDDVEINCYTIRSNYANWGYYLVVGKDDARYVAKDHDYLVLGLGNYGRAEMESPVIIAGKYKVYVEHYNLAASTLRGKLTLLIDGETIGGQFSTQGDHATNSSFVKKEIGEVEFLETGSHVTRFVAGDNYNSYLDCITFEPINE